MSHDSEGTEPNEDRAKDPKGPKMLLKLGYEDPSTADSEHEGSNTHTTRERRLLKLHACCVCVENMTCTTSDRYCGNGSRRDVY